MNWKPLIIGSDNSGAEIALSESGTLDLTQPWTTIRLSSGRKLQVPTEQVEEMDRGQWRLLYDLEELGLEKPLSMKSTVVPLIEEELEVSKKTVPTGELTVKTSSHEHTHLIEEALLKETVSVDRVAIDREVAGPMPVREEGDTTIIPLVEEVIVVQRRYVLREEVRIRRIQEEVPVTQEVTFRTQTASIERSP